MVAVMRIVTNAFVFAVHSSLYLVSESHMSGALWHRYHIRDFVARARFLGNGTQHRDRRSLAQRAHADGQCHDRAQCDRRRHQQAENVSTTFLEQNRISPFYSVIRPRSRHDARTARAWKVEFDGKIASAMY